MVALSRMEEMILKYVIVFLIVVAFVLLVGMSLAVISSDADDWHKELDDREQEAYLRKWNEQQRKKRNRP